MPAQDQHSPKKGLLSKLIDRELAQNSEFLKLLTSCGLNYFGRAGETVIVSLLVYEITGKTEWVGIALALYYLPLAALGLVSGAISDWMNRRTFILILEGAVVVTLSIYTAVLALDLISLNLLLFFTLISGCIRAMYQPVRGAFTYDLVGGEKIVTGLSMINLGSRIGQLPGALLAGSLTQAYGPEYAVAVLVSAHLVSFVLLATMKADPVARDKKRTPILQNIREYIAEIRTNAILLMLVLLTAAVEIFGFSFETAMPELAKVKFEVDAEGLGIMHAARAAGGMAAAMLLMVFGTLKARGTAYLVSIFVFGGSVIALGLAPVFALALIALFFVAALATISDILTQSMVQLSVPDHLRGRAMGAWTLAIGVAPFGHLEMGFLAAALGVGGALLGNGAALILIGLIVALMVPKLRQL